MIITFKDIVRKDDNQFIIEYLEEDDSLKTMSIPDKIITEDFLNQHKGEQFEIKIGNHYIQSMSLLLGSIGK